MTDADLERMMRDGLERRADDVDVTVPVAERASAAVRRRHRGRLAIGLAAASVVTVAVIAAFDSTPPKDTSVPPETGGPAVTDSGWRTEYWADIQVDVPADWAWGGGPHRFDGDTLICTEVERGRPYVGRPLSQTDVCSLIEHEPQPPSAPYVWLDPPLRPGIVDLGDGWIQETVRVGESTLSVAARDTELRERIVASAREQSLCPAELARPPRPRAENTEEGLGELQAAELCAYRSDGDRFRLAFGRELEADIVRRSFAAVGSTPGSTVLCERTDEFVVLGATYLDPYSSDDDLRLRQELVYDLTCGYVRRGGWFSGALRPEVVAPWATGGVSRTLVGPPDQWTYEYFIGMQG